MVYLIGAGPGDAGLITWKGLEILKRCDAVLYDELGTQQLLEYLPADCEKIGVGKRAGRHAKRQEEIHELLIETARRHECVVRLKGGDAFVFGRGGEEAQVLARHGVPYQIVPGVTSAVAVPECAGIPLTHREVSRSFHVFAGHTDLEDADTLAHVQRQPEGTLVFLMGLSNLPRIVERLTAQGEPGDTPAAVISRGTLPGQCTVRGTLADICRKVKESGLSAPAVIVVGETAAFACTAQDAGIGPRLRVGLVGTRLLREKLQRMFQELGVQTCSVCDMELYRTGEMAAYADALHRVEQYHWAVFTSRNAVAIFFETLAAEEIDLRRLSGMKFAAVGSGTGAALRERGFLADYIPERYTTRALAEGLVRRTAPGERILFARARQGEPALAEMFAASGREADIFAVYDVRARLLEGAAYMEGLDFLVFVSASGVRGFFGSLDASERAKLEVNERLQYAAIGEVTERALGEYGKHAEIVPEQSDVLGLKRAFEQYIEKGGTKVRTPR